MSFGRRGDGRVVFRGREGGLSVWEEEGGLSGVGGGLLGKARHEDQKHATPFSFALAPLARPMHEGQTLRRHVDECWRKICVRATKL